NPHKNKFDLRRVRLVVGGQALSHFEYKFEYEFQGAGSRNLLDAYVDAHLFPSASFRIGQFKEPFSLDQMTKDKDIVFAERSLGYYLTPLRDVGLMIHGTGWEDRIIYGLGVFNGDGEDDSVGGDQDSPEFTGRLVLAPFKNRGIPLANNLQVGGSLSYIRADRNNVSVTAKTTGLTTFFNVASSAKFNVIRSVEDRTRLGAELAWAAGPVDVMGEYFQVIFRDIKTSSAQFDTNLRDYYISLLWMITGERPGFRNGVFQPISPLKSIWRGGWGALGLAVRYDVFLADDSVYDNLVNAGDSVKEARAVTIALNWWLDPCTRLILDVTRTDFDQPLLVGRDALMGTALYSDREDVFTGRFQFAF
ncbi:MAG: hypothetical protein HQK60_06525, partial [Deltaproteobacteria bacterium]|nr:hypothetical protein [Deltaproteobacteria bacterium]